MTDLFSDAPKPTQSALDGLIETVKELLAEDGCEWNREQTHESLAKYLVEETYEVVDAIETGDLVGLKEELGDVLYQLLFHAQLAENSGEGFDIQSIAAATNEKMRRRHPHVFGDDPAATVEEIEAMWGRVKAEEKSDRTSVVDGIPMGMPALALAEKLVGRAGSIGLVDQSAESAAIPFESSAAVGQFLLAVVASARAQGFEPEQALRDTLRSFAGEIRDAEWSIGDAGIIGTAE